MGTLTLSSLTLSQFTCYSFVYTGSATMRLGGVSEVNEVDIVSPSECSIYREVCQ